MIASSNFLIPNATLIVEIVAFLIVLGFLAKYVLPPLNKALTERQEQIRNALETADRARAEAEETRAQREGIIDEARQQAREILAQANRTAQRLVSEAEDKGQRENERLVNSAQSEITLARQRAVEEVTAQVGTLVLSVARQVIGREIDPAAHRDLIDEAVAVLRSPAAGAQG
ncbi:MAG: F0F1 ATP synthase subunit B [Acidimicrobiales bacterium]|jgi:F-type H+-transporting ATPase subunit b